MVPLDGVDGVARRGGVGEDAGVAGLHRDVEELHRVAATRRQQRRRWIHEPHRDTGWRWSADFGSGKEGEGPNRQAKRGITGITLLPIHFSIQNSTNVHERIQI